MTAIVLDVETTGFSPEDDRLIELTILSWEDESILFSSLFDPGRPIPPKVVEITKITDEMVRSQPRVDAYASRICEIISGAEAVIGYCPEFDKRMISADLKRCGYSPTWPILVDAKRVWDIYEPPTSRTLTNAYKRFVDDGGFEGAHGALADTRATRAVLRAQFDLFGLHGTPWDQLDPARKSWWGPSPHVLIKDDVLVMNFGKHDGKPVHEVETSFWSWLVKKDFPDHMILLGMKMTELSRLRGEELRRTLTTWATKYLEES